MGIWINIWWVGITDKDTENEKRFGIDGSGWYETFTDDLNELIEDLKKEEGEPTHYMWRDGEANPNRPIGIVFEKECKYDYTKGSYWSESWVEFSTTKPEQVTSYRNVNHPDLSGIIDEEV